MLISVTKPCGEHVIEVQLHGLESRNDEGGGEAEE